MVAVATEDCCRNVPLRPDRESGGGCSRVVVVEDLKLVVRHNIERPIQNVIVFIGLGFCGWTLKKIYPQNEILNDFRERIA